MMWQSHLFNALHHGRNSLLKIFGNYSQFLYAKTISFEKKINLVESVSSVRGTRSERLGEATTNRRR